MSPHRTGFITGISPCILPVLPVIFLSGGAQSSAAPRSRSQALGPKSEPQSEASRWRPLLGGSRTCRPSPSSLFSAPRCFRPSIYRRASFSGRLFSHCDRHRHAGPTGHGGFESPSCASVRTEEALERPLNRPRAAYVPVLARFSRPFPLRAPLEGPETRPRFLLCPWHRDPLAFRSRGSSSH